MSTDTANTTWTESTIVSLRELWDEGHSTAEIGRRLGMSKNAVVGKAHRLDLPARPSPIKGHEPAGPQPRQIKAKPKLAQTAPLPSCVPKPVAPAAAARRDPVPATPPADRQEAAVSPTKTCCWPIGNPRMPGFRFCDAPALVAKPYCEDHANKAYMPLRRPDDKRQEAAAR